MNIEQELCNMLNAQSAVGQFLDDILRLKYNSEYNEFSFSRGKKNYDRIIKRLKEINLPNPLQFTFNKISLEELTSTLKELLLKIIGPEYGEKIDTLSSSIKVEKDHRYFYSTVEEEILYYNAHNELQSSPDGATRTTMKTKNIYISDKLYDIEIVSTGHEYIHALLSQYKGDNFNQTFTNIHYQELLSILIEYILCYELSLILKDETLIAKHDVIRISHDKSQVEELFESRRLFPDIRRANLPEYHFYRQYPIYQEHNAFTYIIGDIYAIHLFEYYKEDKETMNKIIRSILEGEKSLLDLIKYYNLSLRNNQTLELYDNQITRTLKYQK